jgi:hypothetical protein
VQWPDDAETHGYPENRGVLGDPETVHFLGFLHAVGSRRRFLGVFVAVKVNGPLLIVVPGALNNFRNEFHYIILKTLFI